ncbi:26S proteasome non-ATPase regulatory subunit 4 -like protein [Babesia sp. Xinjiang]|uniref:26S proteasome non-ATPase regulatory subunit 4 -like protein n=1 Tax=Babesia sp. Xinjiang TaxID=462227 RepID=UPI000A2597F2|nr:26S proteasome non-ATPase regulatory subunit 4 -like protein [Babesia sp. Xinjiang]ORM41530.1 26S proteasome non-ATPase regulatory subunit 4 -like protein [Babesia sp. Xinjiang]
MTVEVTIICVDNSEYSRNGDFSPNRLAAQMDSIGLIASARMSEHFENMVGIVCFAGRGSRLIAAPSNDLGTFLSGLQLVKPYGESEFMKGLHMAQLALKHRLNKSQAQRIICFIASPVKEDIEYCAAIGRLLKKGNVSVDIVNMTTDPETEKKLLVLYEALNDKVTSHYLNFKPGGDMLLSEMVLNSPVMQSSDGPSNAGIYNSNLNDFGVDPEVDPQLYMALRMSLEQEEERRRREEARLTGAANEGEQPLTLTDVENHIKDLPALEVIPLPRIMEMVMTCEGNMELLESLIYSLPEVDMEDPRIRELLDKVKDLLPRMQWQ